MSDLLGRLIIRAKGAASAKGATSTVEPILASRYEAAVAFEAPPAPEGREPGLTGSFGAGVEPASSRRAEVLNERPRPIAPSSEEPPLTDPKRDSMTRVPWREEMPTPLAGRAPAGPEPARPQQSWADPGEQAAVPHYAKSPGRLNARVEERETQTPNQPASTPEGRAVPMEELSVMVRRGDERPSPQSPSSMPPAGRDDAAHQFPPLPVEVQVTIGHIEVRSAAAPPPVTAPRVARARVGVSLDDYLQRRNGGSR